MTEQRVIGNNVANKDEDKKRKLALRKGAVLGLGQWS